jgi:hypothetical protein
LDPIKELSRKSFPGGVLPIIIYRGFHIAEELIGIT